MKEKVATPGLENRFSLNLSISGGLWLGIVRMRTKSHGIILLSGEGETNILLDPLGRSDVIHLTLHTL
jgi:hypothetical protein